MYQATQAIGRWIVVKTTTIDDSQVNTGGAEESIPTPQKGGPWSMAQSGYTRTDSGESENPLAWSPGTYQQRIRYTAGLVEDMSNTHIEDPGSASTSAVKGNDRADASGLGDWWDWYWSAEYKCEARHHKHIAVTGGWKYEYRSADTAPSHAVLVHPLCRALNPHAISRASASHGCCLIPGIATASILRSPDAIFEPQSKIRNVACLDGSSLTSQ
jgi:hypothetical protein